jgi:hypothetical protein
MKNVLMLAWTFISIAAVASPVESDPLVTSGQGRIECTSRNQKVHVAVVSPDKNFDRVQSLTIVNGTFRGEDLQVAEPKCLIEKRPVGSGSFLLVNCEDQGLVVNQLLAQGEEGHGILQFKVAGFWRTISLKCETN